MKKLSPEELERRWKYYDEVLVPLYEKQGKEVPPHLEPDYFDGWQ